jgi:hypothetical protein
MADIKIVQETPKQNKAVKPKAVKMPPAPKGKEAPPTPSWQGKKVWKSAQLDEDDQPKYSENQLEQLFQDIEAGNIAAFENLLAATEERETETTLPEESTDAPAEVMFQTGDTWEGTTARQDYKRRILQKAGRMSRLAKLRGL